MRVYDGTHTTITRAHMKNNIENPTEETCQFVPLRWGVLLLPDAAFDSPLQLASMHGLFDSGFCVPSCTAKE
eukprot:6478668-Amphidinium_carterae.1